MVSIDPAVLDAILAEQRAARALLERLALSLAPKPLSGIPPTAPRRHCGTSVIKADVLRVLRNRGTWCAMTEVLPDLEVYATPKTLSTALMRLSTARTPSVQRRASTDLSRRWEYRALPPA